MKVKRLNVWIAIIILCMTSIVVFAFVRTSNDTDECFSDFIMLFSRDHDFQADRIKFPLLYTYWDVDEDKKKDITVTNKEYKFIEFLIKDGSSDVAFYDIHPSFEKVKTFNEFPEADKISLKQWGMSDYCNIYFFERIKGKWMLIKIESNDPYQ